MKRFRRAVARELPVSDLLERLTVRRGVTPILRDHELREAFGTAFGARLGGKAWVVSFSNSTLTVAAVNSTWLNELSLLKVDLRRRLLDRLAWLDDRFEVRLVLARREADAGEVSAGVAANAAAQAAWPPARRPEVPPRHESVLEAQRACSAIDDDAVRDAMVRLGARLLNVEP
jgi:hypothetical protein